MNISENIKEQILSHNDKILDVIQDFSDLKKNGTSNLVAKCPVCNKEKGLKISKQKNLFKCFSCDFSGNSAVTYLMNGHNKSFPDSLKYIADKYNIIIENKPRKLPQKGKKKISFCDDQLKESGLTHADTNSKIYDDETTLRTVNIYQSGTLDQYGRIVTGDDMIIWYYDLDGNPITYQKPKTNKFEPFFRVRWQNPALHLDRNGKPMKYRSPFGSGTHIYIPQKIRDLYKHKRKIKRLFLQEGEKKAEKSCKHGIYSIGLAGIQQIAYNNQLPEEIYRLVAVCEVEEVIFLLDSDWNDISSNIKANDKADLRPNSFFYAVRNYRDYFKTFYNLGFNIEIYFGHINPNSAKDKGIDDLLTNTLQQKEDLLNQEIEKLMNLKNQEGDFISLYKISTYTDYKLQELWNLHNAKAFALCHKDILENIPIFIIGRHKWRFNSSGEFESAQPLDEEEKYWDVEEWETATGQTRKKETFKYNRCFRFLQNRGFGRLMMANNEYELIKVDNKIIYSQTPWMIRDFVIDFTKQIATENILDMLYRGGPQYLGPEKLSHLDFSHPQLERQSKNRQFLYFSDKAWEVNKNQIRVFDINTIPHHIWHDEMINFQAKRIDKPLINIQRIDDDFILNSKSSWKDKLTNAKGHFMYDISEKGKSCHFLRFLENTSNFTWRRSKKGEEIPFEELAENATHLIAKMSAIGYLLHRYKDKASTKAVIAMDGKQSEVGASNGRSGKSIMGTAIEMVFPTHYIGAKNKDLTADNFLFGDVTEKIHVIFVDDVRANIDFEFFFPLITGKLRVNPKGGQPFTLPYELTPKLFLTTNHAVGGDGASFRDRQWYVAFSDFYNETHKPVDDFGMVFFDEWDYDQKNLFYNLMAECIQTYLRFGVIESPGERIEIRRLRQFMGEDFLTWAEEYFSEEGRMNQKQVRKVMYDNFLDHFPTQRRYTTQTNFKRKFKSFCKYKGYRFNPHKYDPSTKEAFQFDKDGRPMIDDKKGGVEYFVVADENFELEEMIDDEVLISKPDKTESTELIF